MQSIVYIGMDVHKDSFSDGVKLTWVVVIKIFARII